MSDYTEELIYGGVKEVHRRSDIEWLFVKTESRFPNIEPFVQRVVTEHGADCIGKEIIDRHGAMVFFLANRDQPSEGLGAVRVMKQRFWNLVRKMIQDQMPQQRNGETK
jgi:hypothetical protein